MRKIKVVVVLVRQLQHGFTKNAKVSPNLTVAHTIIYVLMFANYVCQYDLCKKMSKVWLIPSEMLKWDNKQAVMQRPVHGLKKSLFFKFLCITVSIT